MVVVKDDAALKVRTLGVFHKIYFANLVWHFAWLPSFNPLQGVPWFTFLQCSERSLTHELLLATGCLRQQRCVSLHPVMAVRRLRRERQVLAAFLVQKRWFRLHVDVERLARGCLQYYTRRGVALVSHRVRLLSLVGRLRLCHRLSLIVWLKFKSSV